MSTRSKQGNSVARRIRFLRGEETQEAFCRRVGISRSALANYETGRSRPNAYVLSQIAQKTGMPDTYFADPDMLDEPDPASIYGQAIEGRPGWTDDEIAIVRVLRLCGHEAALEVVKLLVAAATKEELTATLGGLFSIKEDLDRLFAIVRRGGRYTRGAIAVDGDTLMRRLSGDGNNEGPQ